MVHNLQITIMVIAILLAVGSASLGVFFKKRKNQGWQFFWFLLASVNLITVILNLTYLR